MRRVLLFRLFIKSKRIVVLLTVIIISTSFIIMDTVFGAETVKSGKCGKNLTWTLDKERKLTISGTGEMYNYDIGDKEAPWFLDTITVVVFEEGVTSIGYDAFFGCDRLNKVIFKGSNVKKINEGSFDYTKRNLQFTCPKVVRKRYKKMLAKAGAQIYKIKIKFDPNGGKVKKKSMKMFINEEYGKLPKATRSDYIFKGWYTKKKGGHKIRKDDAYYYGDKRRLYAHWKRPKLNFMCSIYDYDTRENAFYLALENRSKCKVTILPYGAKIIDYDYKKYDRALRRSKSVKVGFDKEKIVKFKVKGSNTWPGIDRKTMYLYIKHGGKKYKVKCNENRSYYKKGKKWKDTFSHSDERWDYYF